MPSIPLYTTGSNNTSSPSKPNHLPQLLQTPSGIALLEIQGTIHATFPSPTTDASTDTPPSPTQTPIGRLEFPLYDPSAPEDEKWTKRVYLYVGKHQRLVGEAKKLPKPYGVLRKRDASEGVGREGEEMRERKGEKDEALEVLEVVRWKLMFQGRPEPV